MPCSRRSFLKTTSVAAAGLALARPGFAQRSRAATGEQEDAIPGLPREWKRMRKLDVHGHVSSDRRGRHWSKPEALVAACDALGIERIWCSIPIPLERVAIEAVRECNDGVLAAMRRFPDRIGGWCFVQPGNGAKGLAEVDRCLDAGMHGVKLYNQFKLSDPVLFPVAEHCIRRGIPILAHAAHTTDPVQRASQPNASTALDFCALASKYPELKLIMAHVNGGGDWELAIRMLRECSSVFLDTSGSVLDDRTIEMAVALLGHRRVLFGTDSTMEGGVGKILSADLTGEQREAIFWRNLFELLGGRV